MTSLHRPEPRASNPIAKYGPIAAVAVVIIVIAGISIANRATSKDVASVAPTGTGQPLNKDLPVLFNDSKIKVAEVLGITPAELSADLKQGKSLIDVAKARGIAPERVMAAAGDPSAYGDRCDTATGRIKMPTIYAPPCVPVWKAGADNGGATSKGVTKDEITIVEYRASTNGDLSAILQGLLDKPEEVRGTTAAYEAMFQNLFETYGRKVKFVPFQSQGGMSDDVAAKSDAVKIDEELHAFAVIGGPALAQSYAQELAARKIICIGCGQGVPDATFQKLAPYMWGGLASPEQFLLNLGDLITGRLNGKNAEFAGDPDMKTRKRVFGVVHFEQEVPVFKELEDQVKAQGLKMGWEAAETDTYTLDFAKMGERATTIVARMKQAGVTSIIFLGDPFMPMQLTKAATEQGYFPEWIVTGTVLTDTNVLARKYDQKQWAHAFGISSLPVKTPREMGEPWRLHQWYYGQPPAAKTTAPIIYTGFQLLYLGIHMAGPKLTPETFRDGLFNYPPSGGGPTTPHISFGNHGYFMSPITNDSKPDYLGVDDVSLIWWDADAEGKDEGGADGKGLYRYFDGGKRYMPGTMPKTDLPVGKVEGTATILTEVPSEDRSPGYPSPNQPLPAPTE